MFHPRPGKPLVTLNKTFESLLRGHRLRRSLQPAV
jgi:hypothetical protein